ncbi:succinate-semialdehyde dehydrogenase [Lasallia pustulata]|uniref:Succinate-semialdehyde dehydrogenase n=1 Tax=Lasallia pustulata TaxID=136370 RepID=A0A1W5DC22_9LECA|nr:succinate-semialdehyde dehydrogenase [Lasallia pustulata]
MSQKKVANGHHDAPEFPFKLKDSDLLHQQSFVHGKWVESKSEERFDVLDPGTGKIWASCPINSVQDVNAAVESSHKAFQGYRLVNPRTRAKLLLKWNDLITAARDDLATILTYETGKPLAEAYGELDYALGFTWWFAGEAERIQGTIAVPAATGRRVFTVKQPIGVAVALVPWNFPVAMILRKAGAALAAGCTMIVKPSPETPLSCLALAQLAAKSGFPPGAFNVLTTDLENTPSLSEALCKHPLVKKVTFTGSTAVGKIVARHCAEGLKKVTLELGGNCPFIVFDDANLEQALNALMLLKWRHAGQACITANRVYVQAGVINLFTDMLTEATGKLKVGHGAEKDTTMGPVTTPRSIAKAKNQVEDARKHGAKILTGGKMLDGLNGYFFEPTIITGMKPNMLISREESFAPICALYEFQTEEEAVKMANDTSMGLASYFFTKDADRTWRLLENLEAGMIGMNTGNSSAAESPFGGIKDSGYGKESGKDVAVAEYLITKTGTFSVETHY